MNVGGAVIEMLFVLLSSADAEESESQVEPPIRAQSTDTSSDGVSPTAIAAALTR